MSDDSSRMTQAAAVTLVVLMALSIPVTFGAGAAAVSENPSTNSATDEQNDSRESLHGTGVYPGMGDPGAVSGLEGESPLAVGEAVLATQQQRAASGQLDPDMVSKLATQRTKLRGAQALLDRAGATGESGGLTTALELATIGVKTQVAQMDTGTEPRDPTSVELPDVETPTHHSPSAAVFALLERHDVTPSAGQVADIRALDELPEPTRSELTDVLDAYIAYERSTQKAYADVNWGTLRAMSDGNEKLADSNRVDTRVSGPQSVGVDVARVRGAQLQLLEATRDFDTALDETDTPGIAGPATHDSVDAGIRVPLVLAINLSTHANTYTANYTLQIDRGGDDTYNNNAGGSGTILAGGNISNSTVIRSAALVDLGGSDSYNGRNGGGFAGSGFLLDNGTGGDTFDATSFGQTVSLGANGGATFAGLGFLVNAGDSTTVTSNYNGGGHSAINGGGGVAGAGFLIDTTSNDGNYDAEGLRCGQNGGGCLAGTGLLFDMAGDETYDAGYSGTNGGGNGGSGFLVDAGGQDTYIAEKRGTNGGGEDGTGFLLDDGNTADTYNATFDAVNGGGKSGSGFLLDTGGSNDSYIDDHCSTNHDDDTILAKGTVGAQIDRPLGGSLISCG